MGGLAAAIKKIAGEVGINIPVIDTQAGAGRYNTADISSNRGIISILLGIEKRIFSVRITGNTHVWASGETADLHALVRVIDAWINGASLKELKERFPFMDYDRMAEAYENGDPAQVQWELLLEDRSNAHIKILLMALRSRKEFRNCFPYISHGVVRLARDPFSRSMGEVWITPLPVGNYRIEIPGEIELKTELDSMDAAIEAAASYLS